MSLLDKFKDQLPKSENGNMFDKLIEGMTKTKDLVEHPNVTKRRPEECTKLGASIGKILPAAQGLNQFSYFLESKEDVKEGVGKVEGALEKVNELLGKIAKLNCLNEICLKAKLYKQLYEYQQQIEEYEEKIDKLPEQAKEMAMEWVKENMPGAGLAAEGIEAGKKALDAGIGAVKGLFK